MRIIRKIVILPLVISSNPFCGRFRQSQAVIVIDAVKGLLRLFIHHMKPTGICRQCRRIGRIAGSGSASSSDLHISSAGNLNRVILIFFVIHNIINQNPFLVQAGIYLHLHFDSKIVKCLYTAVDRNCNIFSSSGTALLLHYRLISLMGVCRYNCF